ncbi:hypothetical protein [Staphylococcus cornubiensis]|uniref:hypothetical protein n=1 Tax=Staphylococcus cornubiensis TaxID=1986155 RepID=UPI0013563F7D|nr:hypothetical protein [Staphylococcus cornubiensis]
MADTYMPELFCILIAFLGFAFLGDNPSTHQRFDHTVISVEALMDFQDYLMPQESRPE